MKAHIAIPYRCRCIGCGRQLKDPDDNPIYIPYARLTTRGALVDEYWCSQKCLNKYNGKAYGDKRKAG